MDIRRTFKHLMMGNMAVKAVFPAHSLQVIEHAIGQTETRHTGQIRFAVEAALDFSALRRNQTANERAIEVFSQLRVWDTEHNNGVLIYLLLADRDVEIIADRGIYTQPGQAAWEAICQDMEIAFRAGQFETGVIDGIHAVGRHLQQHFPRKSVTPNELPNQPVVL